ncbi:MAG: polysaccharide biosynthesis C-terminal domain-containing protein, partial [Alistipes sp.]|nr:polysaccharide biosynthesis C-terminal domain-containing protein [Alistipes sp.]
MQRDAIDFGRSDIPTLFRKLFIPTLLGMLSISAVTAIDGIFVGHGVGSDGIAAINICIPVLMIFAGFGLMMGAGASVVASIHLARGNTKAARINATQSLLFATVVTLLCAAAILVFPQQTARILGSSETLLPQVTAYLYGFVPGLVFEMWSAIGLFVIRLDGSPRWAMWCNVVSAVANVVLDWLFIFPLGMGVAGAAIASTVSMAIGAAITLVYLCRYADRLTLYRLKISWKSLRLTLRNVGYQCRVGSSALVGEATMAVLMFVGNLVFMHYLGDYGVGAFG